MSEELNKYFEGDDLAASVWKGKYAHAGENTPDDMHKRMAREFSRIDSKYQYYEEKDIKKGLNIDELSTYGKNRVDLTEEAIYELFKDFKYIIPQGSIMASLGTDIIASLSNCWVAESPHDSYGGILKTDSDLAYYYKRRGGVGTDISNLRPAGTSTKNTAKSTTGAVSFMHRFSNTTREVAMEGRRGALMLSIDVNHPDVMDFIKIKRDGTSVTGANISIKLNNEFMKAVENNEDYYLRFPCDLELNESYVDGLTRKNGVGYDEGEFPKIYNELIEVDDLHHYEVTGEHKRYAFVKRIKAKEYWDEIINSAKNYAEPGLMYWDNMMDYDPAATYVQFKPTCSNPCGEQFLNPNDSCRLMVLNLYSFVEDAFRNTATIDYNKLYQIAYEYARLGDNLVDLELEYIGRIIKKINSDPEPDEIKGPELRLWEKSYKNTKAGRRVGLGITALADMLAALNLGYDSEEGMQVIERVMWTKMLAELDCNIDLSILRGNFEGWNRTQEYLTDSLGGIHGTNKFYEFIKQTFPLQFERMYVHGRRSISWSTIAPTGSVSILTQTSSGCEPIFMPYYMRRKKINPNEKGVKIDFVDEIGDSWEEFAVLHPKFKDWLLLSYDEGNVANMNAQDLEVYFKLSPWYGSTANDIDWIKRNQIQAILQKYTTNAISSTINLPSTVTEKEVSDIYMSGWSLGLKGQTVYVDGSRSGVMVSSTKKDANSFEYHDAPKRPKVLKAEVHNVTALGEKFTVVIGLFDEKPYEVFVVENHLKNGKASLEKVTKGQYTVNGELLQLGISDEEVALTRMISTALRHGADIKYVVEQLNKADGTIVSFSKAIARTLKKYVPDGTKSTLTCTDCGGTNVIFEEGCNKCTDCGSSKCG